MRYALALVAALTLTACSDLTASPEPTNPRSAFIADVRAHVDRYADRPSCDPARCNHAGVLGAMQEIAMVSQAVRFCRGLEAGKTPAEAFALLRDEDGLTRAELVELAVPHFCP